jgi:hypothetical protein
MKYGIIHNSELVCINDDDHHIINYVSKLFTDGIHIPLIKKDDLYDKKYECGKYIIHDGENVIVYEKTAIKIVGYISTYNKYNVNVIATYTSVVINDDDVLMNISKKNHQTIENDNGISHFSSDAVARKTSKTFECNDDKNISQRKKIDMKYVDNVYLPSSMIPTVKTYKLNSNTNNILTYNDTMDMNIKKICNIASDFVKNNNDYNLYIMTHHSKAKYWNKVPCLKHRVFDSVDEMRLLTLTKMTGKKLIIFHNSLSDKMVLSNEFKMFIKSSTECNNDIIIISNNYITENNKPSNNGYMNNNPDMIVDNDKLIQYCDYVLTCEVPHHLVKRSNTDSNTSIMSYSSNTLCDYLMIGKENNKCLLIDVKHNEKIYFI